MWNFYDELCTGIPSGIRIDCCVVGQTLTVVRAGGSVGIARTLGWEGVDPDAAGQAMKHTYLRDAANWMKWDSPVRASIGVAAMNAYYNRPGRPVSELCACKGELCGKKVAVIGEEPDAVDSLKGCDLTVLPLPESMELGEEYKAAMSGDVVIISGDTLINRTLPALLAAAGEETCVVLTGVSVPAAPVLFGFDNPVHVLSGLCVRDGAAVEDVLSGTESFCICPEEPQYLHEQPEVSRYEASPYKASKFNSAFNPWEGKEYNKEDWSPIFIG